MLTGSRRRRRRAAPGLVLSTIALTASAGCHWLPVHRLDPALIGRRAQPAEIAAGPTPAATPATAPLPPLPLEPVPDAEALAPVRPTPRLDAALARASAIERAIFEAPTEPAPEAPANDPARPQDAPSGEPVRGSGVEPPSLPTPQSPTEEPSGSPDPEAEPEPEPPPAPSAVATSAPEPDAGPEPSPASPAEPPPAQPVPAAGTTPPADAWRDGLGRLLALTRERAREGGPEAATWELRRRLLEALAGPGPEPEPGTAPDGDGLWQAVLSALAAAEPTDDPARGDGLRAAAAALEGEAPLAITALEICRKVHGFGQFEPLGPDPGRPGQPVLVYCELAGVRARDDGDLFRTRLASTVELIPAGATEAVHREDLGTADDACRRRRRDYFVNCRVTLPADLAPGPYRLRLIQTDLVAGRSAAAEVPLTVAP